jgi:hypothetical protein
MASSAATRGRRLPCADGIHGFDRRARQALRGGRRRAHSLRSDAHRSAPSGAVSARCQPIASRAHQLLPLPSVIPRAGSSPLIHQAHAVVRVAVARSRRSRRGCAPRARGPLASSSRTSGAHPARTHRSGGEQPGSGQRVGSCASEGIPHHGETFHDSAHHGHARRAREHTSWTPNGRAKRLASASVGKAHPVRGQARGALPDRHGDLGRERVPCRGWAGRGFPDLVGTEWYIAPRTRGPPRCPASRRSAALRNRGRSGSAGVRKGFRRGGDRHRHGAETWRSSQAIEIVRGLGPEAPAIVAGYSGSKSDTGVHR